MRGFSLLSLVGAAALATAQDNFDTTGSNLAKAIEPTDFNVTDALVALGVNVSTIPALAALSERSSVSACSIAVSGGGIEAR